MAEAHETDAVLTHLSWEDRAWLHHFPLNRDTVLDYFSNSQFYDRTCLNEQIKMQQGLTREEADAMMQHMTGVEYTLQLAQEQAATATSSARTLYIIQKARRTASKPDIEVLRLYHIVDGVVYEVPSLQAILRARLARLSWLLGSAFTAVHSVTAPDAASNVSEKTRERRGTTKPTGDQQSTSTRCSETILCDESSTPKIASTSKRPRDE